MARTVHNPKHPGHRTDGVGLFRNRPLLIVENAQTRRATPLEMGWSLAVIETIEAAEAEGDAQRQRVRRSA